MVFVGVVLSAVVVIYLYRYWPRELYCGHHSDLWGNIHECSSQEAIATVRTFYSLELIYTKKYGHPAGDVAVLESFWGGRPIISSNLAKHYDIEFVATPRGWVWVAKLKARDAGLIYSFSIDHEGQMKRW
jgi:hypothetical protein